MKKPECLETKNAIANHKRGNTWDGMVFTCEELQEDDLTYLPVNLTGVKVIMQLRVNPDGPVIMEFSTDKKTIVVSDALLGEVTFLERMIAIPAVEYLINIDLIYPDLTVETIVTDKWHIVNSIK